MDKGGKETPAKTNDELAAEYEAKIVEYDAAQQARGRIFDPKLLMEFMKLYIQCWGCSAMEN